MKHVLTTILVAATATLALSGNSYGQLTEHGNSQAKILLHLTAPVTKGACTPTLPNCTQIVTHGDLYPAVYFAYVLVTDANSVVGLAGLQFGISYDGPGATDASGVDLFSWTLCATLEFQQPTPTWPNSGGGNLITWDPQNDCQRFVPSGMINPDLGVVANAGYFYMGAYNDATLRITARPVDGMAKVANCAAAEDNIEGPGNPAMGNEPLFHDPSHLGSAGFGANQGTNPCGLDVPVEPVTWSRLKSLYKK